MDGPFRDELKVGDDVECGGKCILMVWMEGEEFWRGLEWLSKFGVHSGTPQSTMGPLPVDRGILGSQPRSLGSYKNSVVFQWFLNYGQLMVNYNFSTVDREPTMDTTVSFYLGAWLTDFKTATNREATVEYPQLTINMPRSTMRPLLCIFWDYSPLAISFILGSITFPKDLS